MGRFHVKLLARKISKAILNDFLEYVVIYLTPRAKNKRISSAKVHLVSQELSFETGKRPST